MGLSEARNTDSKKALDPLMKKYVDTQRKIEEAKTERRKQQLRIQLDDLRVDLGWTLMDCGKYREGLALYSLLSWTTHGEIKCNGMARAFTEMKCYDEAARILGRGLKRYPNSSQLWVGLGCLHRSLGDYSEALKCFDMAIECSSGRSWGARYNKAIVLEELGSYREAAEVLDDLIEEYPEDPTLLAERGACANEIGDPEDAVRYYQRALKFWTRDPSVDTGVCIYTGLCFAYFEMGEKREAMKVALEGLKRFPDEDPVLYQNVGATFAEMGWKQEAREVLKKGIEKFPEDEALRRFMEDLDQDLDDPDGGINPPILGLILLTALIYKRMKHKGKR